MVAKKANTPNSGGGQHVSEDWTRFGKKQILSIGKKRQRIHDEDYEGEDDALERNEDSSSDEEEGRTSAVKEKKRKVRPQSLPVAKEVSTAVAVDSAPPNKKKKKKGKKERAKEKAEEETFFVEADLPQSTKGTNDESGDKTATVQNGDDPKKDNPKRKRKKVRSRQKNIRKDNRSASEKPSHLILGRSDYAGRPMTKETKDKLGVFEEDKTITIAADDAFERGNWVGGDKATNDGEGEGDDTWKDAGEKEPTDGDPDMALIKIGDCIVDSNMTNLDESNQQDVGENIVAQNDDKRKKKKNRKRKFKNLVVG